ncbi:putative monovalent cation/H+ antiporter subunit A [Sphingobacteriaceae bacterium WQ 2009]|uniref:Putative monovalent cation/H+ antiporter subunit A n=1 Tax=Rhinopithecimicrobium faecis TaxID=2820698 RepID=A0A8T4H5B0_9SPHI|nr:putative monovalent cation/H+ antiporter subunit A [Sphingobacteriaceae bacterium WQ 2009]
MLFTVLSGLITSGLLIPFGKFFKSRWSVLLACLPILLFVYYFSYIPDISLGKTFNQEINWIPSLGVNLSFRLDGLSLLFSLLITGIGSLIVIYASAYLKGHQFLDRFFAYLLLFMSAMLGLVLSNNIILLFIFWELTSISSFFLIGFNNQQKESRKSALTALTITGIGGYFLLIGLLLIVYITGTASIDALFAQASFIQQHAYYPYIVGFVCLGAFTKSAQFPFHFWLPGAMKAPTPVSAYLHSATMVKAGIFVLARFTPILGNTELWSYTLLIAGGVTMVYAAIHSLFRTDLKGVLAYSTIAALGMLTFLLGLGTREALTAALVFIVAHALYKAALFLITGIIDHETGTRDLTLLSGLRKVLLPVFIAGTLAALSSAGLPLSIGFIGKDLIYEATLHGPQQLALYLTIIAVFTNVILVTVGFYAGIKPFLGPLPEAFQKVHLPYRAMWVPPLLLGILAFILGIFPHLLGGSLIQASLQVMDISTAPVNLKIWHGFNTVLLLSIGTLALGTIIYLVQKPTANKLAFIEKFNNLSPKHIFERMGALLLRFSDFYTNKIHNGYLRSYMLKIIIFAEVLIGYELLNSGPISIDFDKLSPISFYEGFNVLILIAAVLFTVSTRSRLSAVVGTSVIGYAICLIFVFYSAPDLAMTQFTIDTLTVVLFVLVLFRLPPFLNFANKLDKIRDGFVAISFGVILSIVALKVLQEPFETQVSDFYGQYAYSLAKGKNVVNVILVDFRGFDTMFEIVVLSIAALGVYSLLKLRLKSSEKE